ncbi:MAG: hypothetical protein ACOYEV_15630 [Candidatus Nanopelagicales bacterium]
MTGLEGLSPISPRLQRVLESAARLQEVGLDIVLVDSTENALHHRESLDHDHVLADLEQRYGEVLEAVEASRGWATSVRASRPPLTIMGSLDGIAAGLRQLRRSRPLETERVEVDSGRTMVVPTAAEMLRIKAYLVVQRNQVRDYLDLVALAEHLGTEAATTVLSGIDEYYRDRSEQVGSVLTSENSMNGLKV